MHQILFEGVSTVWGPPYIRGPGQTALVVPLPLWAALHATDMHYSRIVHLILIPCAGVCIYVHASFSYSYTSEPL